MKKVFLFSFLCILGAVASAQDHRFVIGYNIGSFTRAQNNLQAHAQLFNQTSGDELIKPVKVTGFYRGLVLGWKMQEEHFLLGVRWSTKKMVSSEGENAERTARWRVRHNSLSLEMGGGSERVKLGASLDCGFLRVQKKGHSKVTNKSYGWDPYYPGTNMVKSGGFIGSFTFFTDLQLGRFVELRPFFQLPFTSADISDDVLRKDFQYIAINYGFSLCITLGND